MSIQLPLPAYWARESLSSRDPQAELDLIARDTLDLKFAIREKLEEFAAKHRISMREVNNAMRGYADDMLADLSYEVVREIQREIEERDQD